MRSWIQRGEMRRDWPEVADGVTMVLIPVLIPVLIVLRLCLVCSPTPVTKIPCGGFLKQMSRPAKSAPFKDISAHAMSYS